MEKNFKSKTFVHNQQNVIKKNSHRPIYLVVLFLLITILLGGGAYYYFEVYKKNNSSKSQITTDQILNQNLINNKPKTGQLKTFTGQEFRDLYNTFNYPNTVLIADDSVITGNQAVDNHIQKIAEARGYIRRHAPIANNFINVQEPDMFLQRLAAEDWQNLKISAQKDNIDLTLTAAFRNAKDQRDIFLSKVPPQILSNQNGILAGKYDSEFNNILATTAIPGYSRHHTGYSIDIKCNNQTGGLFENSACFDWLSKDNYKNAKLGGWIPSYPEGAGQQGPEPESWEYVWVGKDAVTD